MSTQFRSRIKTVVSYEGSAAATGGCCLPDGTKLSGDNITINECNRLNGFFRAGDPTLLQCPDRGLTGCCCSCSYIREQEGNFDNFLTTVLETAIGDDGTVYHQTPSGDDLDVYGYKDNVTQCECFNRQGNWFYGKCSEVENVTSFCGSVVERTDVRVPAACCHENTTTDEIDCTNVCTAKECSDLVTPTEGSSGGTSIYYGTEAGGQGSVCDYSYITEPAECGAAVNNTNRERQYCDSCSKDPVNILYPCFELITKNNKLEYKCSQKTRVECVESKGYQYPTRNQYKLGSCSDYSSLMYPPLRGTGSLRVIPPTISSSVQLPSIGNHYQGGMYMGTFAPGGVAGLDPTLVKRRSNNLMEEVPSRGPESGSKVKKWALICSYRPFGSNKIEFELNKYSMNSYGDVVVQTPTTFYDGFFNTYGDGSGYGGYNSDLFEKVRSLIFNGFNDWYIPSIDELSLIYKNYPLTKRYYNDNATLPPGDRSPSDFLSLSPFRGIPKVFQSQDMMSSTLYSDNDSLGKSDNISGQMKGTKGYLYAQNMRDEGNDTDGLVFKADRKKKLVVPLVRRIYID